MAAQLIEQARLASGLTQQAMAEQAGTSRTTLSAYENGRKSPNLETVERLMEVGLRTHVATPHQIFKNQITSRTINFRSGSVVETRCKQGF